VFFRNSDKSDLLGTRSFFSWVDLRWGITDQQREEGKVIDLCLTEVDHSNYFVCMLGERYGWSQTKENLDRVLQKTVDIASQKFPWINQYSDRSVTELEIRHAMEKSSSGKNRRALFLFRDNNSHWITSAGLEEKQAYLSDGEIQLRKLNELKRKILFWEIFLLFSENLIHSGRLHPGKKLSHN